METTIFSSVCIIVIAFILLPRQETNQPTLPLPCKCKDCSNYKDCPIGAGKAILVWKEKESQDLSDKI